MLSFPEVEQRTTEMWIFVCKELRETRLWPLTAAAARA